MKNTAFPSWAKILASKAAWPEPAHVGADGSIDEVKGRDGTGAATHLGPLPY